MANESETPQGGTDPQTDTLTQAHEMANIPKATNGKPPLSLMTRAQLLATPDREYREINVSRWWPGMKVRVQSLTAGERDEWEASYVKEKKDGTRSVQTRTVRAGLVARCLVDETDRPMFTADDVQLLQVKHAGAIDAIYTVCAQMNGVNDEDIEELAKN